MSPFVLLLLYYSDRRAPRLSSSQSVSYRKLARPALIHLKTERDRWLRQMRVQEILSPGPNERATPRERLCARPRPAGRYALRTGRRTASGSRSALGRSRKQNSPVSHAWRNAAPATSFEGSLADERFRRSSARPRLRSLTPMSMAESTLYNWTAVAIFLSFAIDRLGWN
jgi:hypothetical protein